MVNVLKLDIKINKARIYKNLHLDEAGLKNPMDDIFRELTQIIKDNMKLTCIYSIADNTFSLPLCDIEDTEWKKYVICFVSANDNIDSIINGMMSSGDYLKGYILNEISTDVIFNASDEMNKIIRSEALSKGYLLSKRYAPGDGALDLSCQQVLLDALKKTVNIDAYLTEAFMLFPEKSLLYLYGLYENEKAAIKIINPTLGAKTQNIKETMKNESNSDDYFGTDENCRECSNINCPYRKIR